VSNAIAGRYYSERIQVAVAGVFGKPPDEIFPKTEHYKPTIRKRKYKPKYSFNKEEKAERKCLRCGRKFMSWGKANRMCTRCINKESWSNHNSVFHQGALIGGIK